MKTNIRSLILEAIQSDDSFSEKNHLSIFRTFRSSTVTEQKKINSIFINLCGFSMETLIENFEQNDNLNLKVVNDLKPDLSL